MKQNKKIYLIAFLLSLSLILLLEASSLKLLAEDIKVSQKEEVEIELLLSASNDLGGKEAQTGVTEEIQTKSGPALAETNAEADKNSLVEKKEEIIEEKEQFVEDKIIEKKAPPKKVVNKTENKQIKPKRQKNNIIEEEKIETKKVEVPNEPPTWMQNTKSKAEKDNSAAEEKNNQSDKFDLDSFIADLEAKEKVEKNNADKNEQNNDTGNFAVEQNQNKDENKVYDLRKGSSDTIKKPGVKEYRKPSYPSNLRKRNIEGQVMVTLRIDKEGKIHDLRINESSGYDSFDQAALKAVSNWEFKAAEKDNKKIEVIVNLPIKFSLN